MILMPEDLKLVEPFLDEDFVIAAEFYSRALARNPNDAWLLANRSQAYLKLEKFTEAVQDAKKAIELDPSLSKAYLTKGIACMELEEYETAKVALIAGAALDPQNSKFKALIKDCHKHIAAEMLMSAKHKSVPIENESTQKSANGHQGADAPESKPSNRTSNLSRCFHDCMCSSSNGLDYTEMEDHFFFGCRIFEHPRFKIFEKRNNIEYFDLPSGLPYLSKEDSMKGGTSYIKRQERRILRFNYRDPSINEITNEPWNHFTW